VLYESTADYHIASIFSWYFDDCIVVPVANYEKDLGKNIYIIGGIAEIKFKAKYLPDKYIAFTGIDRFETLDKAMCYAKSHGFYN
jgi:hypothetical protein